MRTAAAGGVAGPRACRTTERSTEQVLAGVTLTYDSSFLCVGAAEEGNYRIAVSVTNGEGSSRAVILRRVFLSHSSPRPGGVAPEASVPDEALRVALAPGQSATFVVRGNYALARTDEGGRANLHLRAEGRGLEGAGSFRLGINVHLLAPGATA